MGLKKLSKIYSENWTNNSQSQQYIYVQIYWWLFCWPRFTFEMFNTLPRNTHLNRFRSVQQNEIDKIGNWIAWQSYKVYLTAYSWKHFHCELWDCFMYHQLQLQLFKECIALTQYTLLNKSNKLQKVQWKRILRIELLVFVCRCICVCAHLRCWMKKD